MSVLAEKRKRVKYCINPNGNNWTNDDSKFGQKLLEKMGWKKGEGLGARNQGITERLKVPYKFDNTGLGFKEKDVLLKHQSSFQNVLSQLNNDSDENNKIKKSITSLEEKSKNTKSRVHYKKFTHGKDVSRYSSQDLSSILGVLPFQNVGSNDSTSENDKCLPYGVFLKPSFINKNQEQHNSNSVLLNDKQSNITPLSYKKVDRYNHPDNEGSKDIFNKTPIHDKELGGNLIEGKNNEFGIDLIKSKKKKSKKKKSKKDYQEYYVEFKPKLRIENPSKYQELSTFDQFEDINSENGVIDGSLVTAEIKLNKRKSNLSMENEDNAVSRSIDDELDIVDSENINIKKSKKKKKKRQTMCNDISENDDCIKDDIYSHEISTTDHKTKKRKRRLSTENIEDINVESINEDAIACSADVNNFIVSKNIKECFIDPIKENVDKVKSIIKCQSTSEKDKETQKKRVKFETDLKSFKKYVEPNVNEFLGSNLEYIVGYGN